MSFEKNIRGISAIANPFQKLESLQISEREASDVVLASKG